MKALKQWLFAALALGGLLVATAPAAVEMFLEIEGIEGESADDEHLDEIEIDSFSWGVSNPGSFRAGAAKVNIHDFQFLKFYDASSPSLFLACVQGRVIPEMLLTVRYEARDKAAPPRAEDDFLKVTFSDVIVTRIGNQADTTGEEGTLAEQFAISFGHIEIEYTPLGPDGEPGEPIIVGYDVKHRKADVPEE